MDQYVTGTMIKRLREEKNMTQSKLAEMIFVSDKAISKWETGRGYPDITLLEPLAKALGVSVIELFSGRDVTNKNRCFNILKAGFYVCPVCGNIIQSTGEAVVSCCGITLPALEASEQDGEHRMEIVRDEDEYYVSLDHEMTKTHYISFVAAVKDDGTEFRKFYPEGGTEARFKVNGVRFFYFYCNRHGLFKASLKLK